MLREAIRTAAVAVPTALAGWASDAPGAVALRVGGRSVTTRTLDQRVRRLAAGLWAIRADEVHVVCCTRHLDDLLVAHLASRVVGATVHRHAPEAVGAHHAGHVLACAEGTAACSRTGNVIGDGPFVRWWPLFERSYSPLPAWLGADPDEVELLAPVDEQVHDGDVGVALSALAARIPQRVAG